MSSESSTPWHAALFDRLVAHEVRGDGAARGSLRPRLPYAFDAVAASERDNESLSRAVTSALPEVIPERVENEPAAIAAQAMQVPAIAQATSNAAPAALALMPSQRARHDDAQPATEPAARADGVAQRVVGRAPSRLVEKPSTLRERRESVPALSTDAPRARDDVAPERMATQPLSLPRPDARAPAFPSRARLRAMPVAAPIAPAHEPVIEIRIGRIDVRAATPPPPGPVRQREPESPALGTYLGRRSRGSRS